MAFQNWKTPRGPAIPGAPNQHQGFQASCQRTWWVTQNIYVMQRKGDISHLLFLIINGQTWFFSPYILIGLHSGRWCKPNSYRCIPTNQLNLLLRLTRHQHGLQRNENFGDMAWARTEHGKNVCLHFKNSDVWFVHLFNRMISGEMWMPQGHEMEQWSQRMPGPLLHFVFTTIPPLRSSWTWTVRR